MDSFILSFMMHGIRTQGSIHKIFKRIHKIYNIIRTIKTEFETYNFKLKDLIKSKKKSIQTSFFKSIIKVSFIIYNFLWNLPPCTRSFQIQFRTFIFSSSFKHWFSILLDKKDIVKINLFCIPITFNIPIEACFSNKKY